MKKALKYLLILVGLVCGMVVLLLGLLLIPGVQRSLIERTLSQPGRELAFERLAVRPGYVEVTGMQLQQEGMRVSLDRLRLDWSPLALIARQELSIASIVVDALDVELSPVADSSGHLSSPPTSDETSPALALLLLPEVPLQIDAMQANGSLRLADGQRIQWTATGGAIAPETEGGADFELSWDDDQLTTVVKGRIDIQQSEKRWERVRLSSDLIASGELLPEDLLLALSGQFRRLDDGEQGELIVTRMGQGSAHLLRLQVNHSVQQQLSGQIDLNVNDEALRPFAVGRRLPAFNSRGQFQFEYGMLTKQGKVDGALEGSVREWQRAGDGLEEIPPLHWHGTIASEWDAAAVAVDDLQVVVSSRDSATSLLEVSLQEPFVYRFPESSPSQVEDVLPLAESLRVDLRSLPLVWFNPFLHGLEVDGLLSGAFALRTQAGGDVLELTPLVPTVLDDFNLSGEKPLLRALRLQATPLLRLSEGRLSAQLDEIELTSAAGTIGAGTLIADFLTEQALLTVQTALEIELSALAAQPLVQVGKNHFSNADQRLKLKTDLDYAVDSKQLSVSQLDLTVSTGHSEQGHLRLKQPIRLALESLGQGLDWLEANANGEILEIAIDHFPLAQLSPLLPQLDVSGWISRLRGNVTRGNDRVRLTMAEPIQLRVEHLAQDGEILLANADIQLNPLVELAGQSLLVRTGDLRLRTGDVELLQLDGGLQLIPGKIDSLQLDQVVATANLAGLATQPGLVAYGQFLSGAVRVVANGSPVPGGRFSVEVAGNDWRLGEPLRSVQQLTASLQGDWSDPQRLRIEMPLRVSGAGGDTDLNGSGWVGFGESAQRFDFQLTGSQVVVEDLLLLAGIFSAADPAAGQGVQSSAGTPFHTGPLWGDWQGKLNLALDHVLQGGRDIRDVSGELLVTPQAVVVPEFRANLTGSILQGQGQLQFHSQQRQPYQLTGSAHLPNFDLGRFLLSGSDGGSAPMEGLFNAGLEFTGRGEDLQQLIEHIQGDFDLEGRNGALRILAATGNESVGNTISMIAMQLGGRVRELRVVNDLIGFLREVPYDRLAIRASRGEDLNIDLSQVLLTGPELKLEGRGGIRYRQDVPFWSQALSIDTQLAARGNLAHLFGQIRLMQLPAEPTDAFLPGPSFRIGGTAANPDFTSLRQIIERAAMGLISSGLRSPQDADEQQPQDNDTAPRSQDPLRSLLEGFLGR